MNASEQLAALDLAAALRRVGGDETLLREIAEIFLAEQVQALAAIRHAMAAGDGPALEHAAHVIKGEVANFGAARATEAAFRLEKAGREGRWEEARAGLEELEAALARLNSELEAFLRRSR